QSCMYFNKKIAEDNGIDGIYDLVKNGQWTIDKVGEVSKGVYSDLNGNGVGDKEDRFGYIGNTSNHSVVWLYACDIDTLEFHDDGSVTSVFNNERAVTFLEKLDDLFYRNPGSVETYYSLNNDNSSFLDLFMTGHGFIYNANLLTSETLFRELEFDYGIVPYAKFDENQERYYTVPAGAASGLAVPMTVKDDELVGFVITAMGRESYVNVIPVYYDIVLKTKGVRDETSVEMLDIIMDGRMVTTEFLYDNFKGYSYKVYNIMKSGQELASFTAANDSAIIAYYENVLELFYS
nr:hypothetical protein [Clostridia bacterium]